MSNTLARFKKTKTKNSNYLLPNVISCQKSFERFLPVQVVESVSVEAEHWEESWWESGAEVLALGFYSKGRTEQV